MVAPILLLLVVASGFLPAQVVTPMELSDPKAQHLQQRHLQTLMAIGQEIEAHPFPYPFYFSRALDVDLERMQAADQRSIRFDIYNHQTVLEITGNYYACYAAERMDAYARLKETFTQVIAPILRAEVPHFPDDSEFSAFAIEIAHHVRQKVMGISAEVPENVTVILPVAIAQKFVDASNDDQRQAAILEAQVFLNGQPYSLWLHEGTPSEEWKESNAPPLIQVKDNAAGTTATGTAVGAPSVSSNLLKDASLRIITPEILAGLQRQNQDTLDRIVKALDADAHFLAYAPPSFIAFRQATYLQLSFRTALDAAPASSRYKLAALAFDEHVSHLIRPLIDYFPAEAQFDGVDFSTTVRVADGSRIEAVEFFLPLRMMRCFVAYDCTGQQLLDSGTVIIDGERAALDLQIAEGRN